MILLLIALAAGWLARMGLRDPKINFLSRNGAAEWILFPAAVDGRAHQVANLDTIFRREFLLTEQPRRADLEMRAAKHATLTINGAPVEIATDGNWKEVARADVAAKLRAGSNRMEVRVFNDNAPPALWLRLTADGSVVRSDQAWESSCAGSAWRPAALAAIPRLPGPGSALAASENVFRALRTVWLKWLIFAALAVVVCVVGRKLSPRHLTILLAIIAAFWVLLFLNNARFMPFLQGFDAQDHLNYIKFIQERGRLPWPTEGFEMFQPPLYYLISAATLSLCGLSVEGSAPILVLRFLTLLFALLQIVFVLLSLRLLFPKRIAPQLVGLIMAAFLPMQIYLSHYVTNETLAATLVTASLYLGLRLLKTKNPSFGQLAVLGLTMGAAMLTKATALLLVAPLFLALLLQLAAQRAPGAIWLRQLGTVGAIFFATCGWHYLRIWRRFGTPLLGNWEAASGFSWWQDPGFHTGADYLRFGQSLVAPLYSGFWSFGDGIYSTLWGDALCGGVSNPAFRPPWNYDLMVAGYWLALVPTLLILTGAAVAFWRFVRRPSLDWFVLFGLTGAILFGVVTMTLKVASYAQVKAFYGLAMIVPICVFVAIGWEVWTRGHRIRQGALGAVLVFFAMNSFASFWVIASPAQQIYAGNRLALDGKFAAAALQAAAAVQSDPANATAHRLLAAVWNESGRAGEALPHAQRAVELRPIESASHLQLGIVLATQNQLEPALAEIRRALELGRENLSAYDSLLATLSKMGRREDIISDARDALAVAPFIFEPHHTLGVALAQKEDFIGAAQQFVYALLLQPESAQARANLRLALRFLGKKPDAAQHVQALAAFAPTAPFVLNEMAWFFATQPDETLRNGTEAVRLAEQACALTGRTNPAMLATLAAASAESGRIPEAIDLAEEAQQRARAGGEAETAALSEELLAAFRADHAYHEDTN